MTEWSYFVSKANTQHCNNPSWYPKHWCQRSWSWTVLWPSWTNTKDVCPFLHFSSKICLFHQHQKNMSFCISLECKSLKSRDTWSNRQVWPWSTKWSRAKANRVLSREHTGHSKHPFLTTQETTLHMDITKMSTLKSDWLHSLQLKTETLYSQQKQNLDLTGSSYQLLISKLRLKLKKATWTDLEISY